MYVCLCLCVNVCRVSYSGGGVWGGAKLQTKFISACNNVSAITPEATRSNLREPKIKNFLGEHTPRPPRSSMLRMINSFPSRTKKSCMKTWCVCVYVLFIDIHNHNYTSYKCYKLLTTLDTQIHICKIHYLNLFSIIVD